MNIKKKILAKVRSLKKSNVTTKNDYIDSNGLRCFNGHIADVLGLDERQGYKYIDGLRDCLSLPVKEAINQVHFEYINGVKTFTTAKNKVIEIIESGMP